MIILYFFILIIAIVLLRVIFYMPKDMLKDIATFKFITNDDIAFSILFWSAIITIIWMSIKIIQYIF
jgi:hypothetical protein